MKSKIRKKKGKSRSMLTTNLETRETKKAKALFSEGYRSDGMLGLGGHGTQPSANKGTKVPCNVTINILSWGKPSGGRWDLTGCGFT